MSNNEFSQLIIAALEPVKKKWAYGSKLKIEFHPNICRSNLRTALEKIAPGMQDNETPLVLIDMAALAGFFSSPCSKGIVLSSHGLYENVSWFEYNNNVPLKFPWESINSIELRSPYSGQQRVLLNGIPLLGIFETIKQYNNGEFQNCLYQALKKIYAGRPSKEPLSLKEIAKSYQTQGLLSPTIASKPELDAEGLAKAACCFREFRKDEDQVLFHLYEKKSFWSNEVQLLITDRGIFAYADYVDDNNYEYWDLNAINDIRVEHSYGAGTNSSGLYINKAFVYGTSDQDYSSNKIVRYYCVYNNYAKAALICEIINSIKGENAFFPLVFTNVDIGSVIQTNRGPLKSLQQNGNPEQESESLEEATDSDKLVIRIMASDGPMPHHREMMKKAAEKGLHVVVKLNDKGVDDPELIELVIMEIQELLEQNGFTKHNSTLVAPNIPKKSTQTNEDCFVITAVCGRRDDPIVLCLRQWRDSKLRKHKLGCAMIACYNKVGPQMAAFIRKHPKLRRASAYVLHALFRRSQKRS